MKTLKLIRKQKAVIDIVVSDKLLNIIKEIPNTTMTSNKEEYKLTFNN